MTHALKSYWQFWFKPRSQDRADAFAERCIRVLIPVLFLILGMSYADVLSRSADVIARWTIISIPVDLGFLTLMFVGATVAVVQKRIRLAGIILSGILLYSMILSMMATGYWEGAHTSIAILLVLVSALFLSDRVLVVFSIATMFLFPLVGMLQESAGRFPPLNAEGAITDTPWGTFSAALFTVGMALAIFLILKQEYRKRTNEVQELVNTLEQRVIERTKELEQARQETERLYHEQLEVSEKLRAVDQMKSQFLASMSHELRTPLNAILNFTEFVTLGMMGPVNDKQQDALNKSLDSGRHLLSLINDVLDMTKIESGMLKLFVEENLNLHHELQQVIAPMQTLLKGKPVSFVQDIDSNLPLIAGDRRRIRQILLNLVSNAAKFTEEGSITLSAKKRENDILFAVIDTGPGIDPHDHDLIFEPFKQTETGIRHAGGTGLGLPISKKLAEAHGGKLWVESHKGEGAAFYFTLPIHSAELIAMAS
jgi:signal transduction histidine kinase